MFQCLLLHFYMISDLLQQKEQSTKIQKKKKTTEIYSFTHSEILLKDKPESHNKCAKDRRMCRPVQAKNAATVSGNSCVHLDCNIFFPCVFYPLCFYSLYAYSFAGIPQLGERFDGDIPFSSNNCKVFFSVHNVWLWVAVFVFIYSQGPQAWIHSNLTKGQRVGSYFCSFKVIVHSSNDRYV